LDEALAEAETAVKLGCRWGFGIQAFILKKLGRCGDAFKAAVRAASGGDCNGYSMLASLYSLGSHWDRFSKAVRAERRALELGGPDPESEAWIMMWSWDLSGDTGLLPALEAAEKVVPEARVYVGDVFRALGRLDEAEAWYLKAADGGDNNAFVPLGNLYSRLGFVDKAMDCYQRGFELGDAFCAFNAGLDVAERGDWHGSLRWIRLAADGGDARARKYLSSAYRAGKNRRRKGLPFHPSGEG
jgi:tetratricopeptide (TPR) repeat protein